MYNLHFYVNYLFFYNKIGTLVRAVHGYQSQNATETYQST